MLPIWEGVNKLTVGNWCDGGCRRVTREAVGLEQVRAGVQHVHKWICLECQRQRRCETATAITMSAMAARVNPAIFTHRMLAACHENWGCSMDLIENAIWRYIYCWVCVSEINGKCTDRDGVWMPRQTQEWSFMWDSKTSCDVRVGGSPCWLIPCPVLA